MITTMHSDTVDLWEAWIDLQGCNDCHMLYVIGDICTGKSKITPVLLKKEVQGVEATHLILEVLPFEYSKEGRTAEVRYTEHIADLSQYQQISICAGERIIARINSIEVLS
jgi:hypothetical protein